MATPAMEMLALFGLSRLQQQRVAAKRSVCVRSALDASLAPLPSAQLMLLPLSSLTVFRKAMMARLWLSKG